MNELKRKKVLSDQQLGIVKEKKNLFYHLSPFYFILMKSYDLITFVLL